MEMGFLDIVCGYGHWTCWDRLGTEMGWRKMDPNWDGVGMEMKPMEQDGYRNMVGDRRDFFV